MVTPPYRATISAETLISSAADPLYDVAVAFELHNGDAGIIPVRTACLFLKHNLNARAIGGLGRGATRVFLNQWAHVPPAPPYNHAAVFEQFYPGRSIELDSPLGVGTSTRLLSTVAEANHLRVRLGLVNSPHRKNPS